MLLRQGYRYALSLAQQSHLAEDILQSAFLATLKVSKPVNKAYLFTTIRNTYFNLYKRDKLVPMMSYEQVKLDEFEESWEELTWVENNLDLDKALATLRTVEREIIYLAYVEQYSALEIATFTGLGRGTVLSLMHRARQKLKTYLQASIDEVLK